jgi:hypothetical protein
MKKWLVSVALILTTIAVTTHAASALPISTGLAENLCKGTWVHNMETGVRICAYCQKTAGKPRCDYFVCDSSNCEWIIVEKRKPGGRWSRPTPVVPKGAR